MPHPSHPTRRTRAGAATLSAAGAVLVVGAVLLFPGAGLAAPAGDAPTDSAPAENAAVTSDPAEVAAGWLASQLVDGNHMVVEIDLNGDGEITDDERFPDYGLTADTIIALASAGVGGESISAATDYLAANIELYVGDADIDDDGVDDPDGEYYAGALGKALLVTAVTGRDGTDFGGVDLLARLLSTETPTGRFSDVSAFGDFSNNVGQSFAALALTRTAPALLSPAAQGFLPGQQCRDGGPRDGNVPVTIGGDPCAAEAASVDTTSIAAQAMTATGETAAATAGVDFLLAAQDSDGGFSDMGLANANSTGLAAQALRVGGPDAAADAAVGWLLELQIGCLAPAEQQGAIAFTAGPDGQPVYDDRAPRATAQATAGLAGVGLAAVTAEGADPAAPRLDCDDTTPSPTPTATSSAPPSGTTSAPPAPPTATAPPTSPPGLPNTGTAVVPLLALGLGSLGLGGGLLLAGRRRSGAHR